MHNGDRAGVPLGVDRKTGMAQAGVVFLALWEAWGSRTPVARHEPAFQMRLDVGSQGQETASARTRAFRSAWRVGLTSTRYGSSAGARDRRGSGSRITS